MQLRPYQKEAAEKAALLIQQYHIAYFAWHVRTGKTITSLFTAKLLDKVEILFVTKKKAIGSIQKDAELLQMSECVYITNYDQLHNLPGKIWDLVIIDEAHSIGSFPLPSLRAKLLKDICKCVDIIYLSGTPTPESFSQIYYQFWVSTYSPFNIWYSFYKWAKDFVELKKKYLYNREINDYTNANKELIDQHCAHLFLTMTQEEAGFESLVEEEVLEVEMKPSTYWLANKLIKDRVYIGKEGQEIVCDTAVKLQGKLHQIYSGSVIAENIETAMVIDHSKVEFIKSHFMGLKIAVFYKFQAEKGMLLWAFAGRICETPEMFNSAGNDAVFIAQFVSGREGLNLSTANCLIFMNIDFSYLSYAQARARMQSKERTTASRLFWIFSKGGIEWKIYEKVKNKSDYTNRHFQKDFNLSNARSSHTEKSKR